MRNISSVLVFLLLFSAFPPAYASGQEPFPYFNRNDTRLAVKRALSSVHKVSCGKEKCARATTEEFVSPPISLEDARIALIGGAQSARLRWCGLKWHERTLRAILQEFQQRGIHSRRYLEMLQLIHNHQYNKDYANLQVLETCSDERRAALDKQHPPVKLAPWQGIINNALLDTSVTDMLQRVLKEIHNAKCGQEQCAPTSKKEQSNPPVSIDQARQAMKVGLMAGMAEFCKLDWKNRIFFPFMTFHRTKTKMKTRELSILAMLHATMQGFMRDNYKKHEKTCSDRMRRSLERQLSSG